MQAKVFGFSTPVTLKGLKPGTLLAVELEEGERTIGFTFETEHDDGLIVFWSNRDTQIPRALDFGQMYRGIGKINGTLEIEPESVADAFKPAVKRWNGEGFVVDDQGRVGMLVDAAFFGSPKRAHLDLATGKPVEGAATFTPLMDVKLFIAQEGRRERIPLLDLVP